MLRYLKGIAHYGLHFTPAPLNHFVVEGYVDADWASWLDDRRSTSGYYIYLGGKLIAWSSKKQAVMARSSTESEYRTLAQAAAEVIWFQSLFHKLGIVLSTKKCLVI